MLSSHNHAFPSNKTESRKQGCLFNCNYICCLRSASSPEPRPRGPAQPRASSVPHCPVQAGARLLCFDLLRPRGAAISSAGDPASGAQDRGGGRARSGKCSHLCTHMQTSPVFAFVPPPPSLKRSGSTARPLLGRHGQHGGAPYFCIWNRKSRRLMFLAASSLLHSTESTMGSGT